MFQREPLNDFLRRWHVTSARPFDLVGTAKAAPIRSPYSYFLAGYELSGAIFLLFEAIAAAHGPINYAHPSALLVVTSAANWGSRCDRHHSTNAEREIAAGKQVQVRHVIVPKRGGAFMAERLQAATQAQGTLSSWGYQEQDLRQ